MLKEILPNVGFIRSKLDKETMDRLKSYIKNKKGSHKTSLAGNISGSYNLKDKDNWFFENVLLKLLNEYGEDNLNAIVPSI